MHVLPSPGQFKEQFPDLYESLFKDAAPVPCKIDQGKLLRADAVIKCRDTGSAELAINARKKKAVPTLDISQDAPPASMIQTFGSMMMKSMEQMQASQNRMVEMMMGNQAGLSDFKKPMPSMRRALSLPELEAGLVALQGKGIDESGLQAAYEGQLEFSPPPYQCGTQLAIAACPHSPKPDEESTVGQATPIVAPLHSWSCASAGDRVVEPSEKKRRLALALAIANKSQKVDAARVTMPTIKYEPGAAAKRPSPGDVIADMIRERDLEKKVDKKAGQDQKNVAHNKEAMVTADHTPKKGKGKGTQPKSQIVASTSVKGQDKDKHQQRPCDGALSWVPLPVAKTCQRWMPPHFLVQRAHSQIMLRTGLKAEGQTHILRYGEGTAHATEEDARRVALTWKNEQLAKLHA